DPLGGKVERLLGGAALAVQRDRRGAFGETGGQNRVPADIAGLLSGLDDAARNDVLDQPGIDIRALKKALQDPRIKINRVNAVQDAPLAPPAERGANHIDYDSATR